MLTKTNKKAYKQSTLAKKNAIEKGIHSKNEI